MKPQYNLAMHQPQRLACLPRASLLGRLFKNWPAKLTQKEFFDSASVWSDLLKAWPQTLQLQRISADAPKSSVEEAARYDEIMQYDYPLAKLKLRRIDMNSLESDLHLRQDVENQVTLCFWQSVETPEQLFVQWELLLIALSLLNAKKQASQQ
jgi:hypothetical protein